MTNSTGSMSFDEHDVNTHAQQKTMVITNGRIAASIHILIFIVLKLTVLKQATNLGTFLDITKFSHEILILSLM